MIIRIIEVLSALATVVIFVTQMVIPALRKRPLFPIFRWRRRRAEDAVIEAGEEVDIGGMKKEADNLMAAVEPDQPRSRKKRSRSF